MTEATTTERGRSRTAPGAPTAIECGAARCDRTPSRGRDTQRRRSGGQVDACPARSRPGGDLVTDQADDASGGESLAGAVRVADAGGAEWTRSKADTGRRRKIEATHREVRTAFAHGSCAGRRRCRAGTPSARRRRRGRSPEQRDRNRRGEAGAWAEGLRGKDAEADRAPLLTLPVSGRLTAIDRIRAIDHARPYRDRDCLAGSASSCRRARGPCSWAVGSSCAWRGRVRARARASTPLATAWQGGTE